MDLLEVLPGVEATIMSRIPFPQDVLHGSGVVFETIALPNWLLRLPPYLRDLLEEVFWVIAIIKMARRSKSQLIHLNNGVSYNLSGLIAARILQLPVVVHQRGWEQKRKRLSLAKRFLRSWPVLAISDAVLENLKEQLGADVNAQTVYDVVRHPSKRYARHDHRLAVGMHGMITPWKGQQILVEAAALLREYGTQPIIYRIAGLPVSGSEPFLQELKAQIVTLGLDKQFEFVGLVGDIYEFLNNIDISVHASIDPEPLGRVIVEAQLAAVPIIASRAGGAIELIAEGEGLFFSPKSAQELAARIHELASSTALRNHLGAGGQQAARRRFNSDQLMIGVQSVYSQILL